MFKRNEGVIDRIVRVALGTVLLPAGLFLLGGLQGSAYGLVAAGFGGWVLITGIIGFCPLYIPLGINTLEKEKELIARCKSMMAGFRQGSAGSGQLDAEQPCGPCPPSIGKTHHQEG
jgi:hypothetical protein